MKKSIFITGGTGFIGSHLTRFFIEKGHPVHLYLRNKCEKKNSAIVSTVTDVDHIPCVDVVLHLAARVHMMVDKSKDSLHDYRKVNVDFTVELAQKAISMGVKLFIFFSSVKVYGEKEGTFSEKEACFPTESYGLSKLEAEERLKELFSKSEVSKLIILRLPMVYGSGNKGNILTLIKYAKKNFYLPLGYAKKKRSFLYVGNILDLMGSVINSDFSLLKDTVFNVTDGEDVSASQLYLTILNLMGKGRSLIYFPPFILKVFTFIPFVRKFYFRVFCEYCFSSVLVQRVFKWTPKYNISSGVCQMLSEGNVVIPELVKTEGLE